MLYNLSFFQKKNVAWCIGVGLVTESFRAPAPRLKNDISWHTLTHTHDHNSEGETSQHQKEKPMKSPKTTVWYK